MFKEEVEKYKKALELREKTINTAVNQARKEIEIEYQKGYDSEEKSVRRHNESPCSVCKKTSFVLKYRNTVGKVEGKVSGSFSLFGGSISGYVDGNIETLPVLSCRDCENERIIEIARFVFPQDIIKSQMPTLLAPTFDDHQATEWLKSKGLEVARKLAEKCYFEYESERINSFSDSRLAKVGLFPKYPLPQKPNLLKLFLNKII